MKRELLPDIFPKWTKAEEIIEIVSLILFCYTVGSTAITLKKITTNVPTHFSLMGMPDGYGNKYFIVSYLMLSFVIFALLWILQVHLNILRYPVKITEQNAEKYYKKARLCLSVLKLEATSLFAYLMISTELIAEKKMAALFPGFKIVVIAVPVLTLLIFYKVILDMRSPEEIKDKENQ